MMSLRLVWLEITRMLTQQRFWFALLVMLGLSLYSIWEQRSPTLTERTHRQGALSQLADDWLPLTTPIVAGIVAAGSLAADRRHGYMSLVLARGVSRRQYLGVKAVAMVVSSALALLIGCLMFFIIALALPAGRPPLTNGINGTRFSNQDASSALNIPGPVPHLFRSSPILNDVLSVGMMMAAAASLSLIGLLIGVLVPNEYVAVISPLFATIVSMFALLNFGNIFSLFTYLDIWIWYRDHVPTTMLGYAAFLYWLLFGTLMLTVASILFTRRELD